ncbi:MAG: DUF2442 domain-containing protein [Thermoguttaceae bacterium]|jgi:hypothetical protein
MERIPGIAGVEPVGQAELLVRFENGVEKTYDCRPLLGRPQFRLLADAAFFRAVRVDPGGYGISWSDDIDLSEYELWIRGTAPAKEAARPEGHAG